MMTSSTRIGLIAAGSIIALVIIPMAVFMMAFRPIDYGKLPKDEVFQRIFRKPLPPDITEIQIAGHGAGQGHNVWMRIRAPRQTLVSLLKKSERISAAEFWKQRDSYQQGQQADPDSIGWNAIRSMRHATYFTYNNSDNNSGWVGFAALDSDSDILYAFAEVL